MKGKYTILLESEFDDSDFPNAEFVQLFIEADSESRTLYVKENIIVGVEIAESDIHVEIIEE